MPKTKTQSARKKPIGTWVYHDTDRDKARFSIAAARSAFKSTSNFFAAAADKAVKEQERKLGPITDEMITEFLGKGRHTDAKKSHTEPAAV